MSRPNRPTGCACGKGCKWPRFDHAKALRLDDERRPYAEIAEACDVSTAAISRLLVLHGRFKRPAKKPREVVLREWVV